MKKKLFLAGLLTTFSLVAKSQVGINTATPTATLDVTAKSSTGTGSAPEGLLIPRVDRQKAQSMTGVPTSTLIYVNSIATGTAAGTAVNIDTAGYYYYNGTVWTKLNTPVNIYNADGTLTGNRTVTQGANTLAFTGTQTNAFSVDGNTLSVDAANDRVGVGTTTPDTKLTISTPDNSFGLHQTNGVVSLKSYIGGGAVSLGTTTANDLRFTTSNTQKMSITSAGDVGIGTNAPDTKLTISTGDNNFGLNHTNGTINLKTYIGGGSGYVGTTTSNNLNLMTNNASRVTVNSVGSVGVNTPTPGTTLDVNGAITNRETSLAVAGNAVTIPANVSQVQLTGAATANVAISAFAAPNPGQRLIVYNNTTGGFGATLDGTTVPNGEALEFVFSNSLWRSTDGGTVGATPVNIYTANGTLTGNRTVTQGANTLAFTGTQTNAFSVDGNTLSVDAANGRVGVGTTTPDTKLTISTPDNSFGLNHTNGSVNLKSYIGGGVVSLGTTTVNDLRFITNNTQKMSITSAGDVGIGTNTPDTKLTISTGDNSFGLNHTNGTINLKTYIGAGAAFMGTTTSNNLNLMTNNNSKVVITPAGNVGIGTNTPDSSALLDINATNKGLLLPRVPLSSKSDASTVPSPATGLMVYNNNTAMSPQGTGIYYNGGTPAAPDWGKIGPVSKMYFKYYTFTNPNGDFIANFDTKIPTSSYTAIVVGFDTNNHGQINAGFKNASTNFDFQAPDIYTFQQNGTWRIYADVPNADTTSASSFTWGIRLLIISNEQMTTLGTGSYNLGGSTTGAATASPVP